LAEAFANRSKPTRFQNINQLLRRVYDLEIFEKQIKKRNVDINVELYDKCQDVMEKHDKTLDRNKTLMKENTKLYRELRLKMKYAQASTPKHLGLETLAELVTTLDDKIDLST
jgi:hypothetical protein